MTLIKHNNRAQCPQGLTNLNEFDHIFGRLLSPWFEQVQGCAAREESGATYRPLIEVRQNENSLTVDVEMPGIASKDVEITLHENLLTIKGEKTAKAGDDAEDVHIAERRYGKFERALRVPTAVDETAIKAVFTDGVLQVTLPLEEKAKPRKIVVN